MKRVLLGVGVLVVFSAVAVAAPPDFCAKRLDHPKCVQTTTTQTTTTTQAPTTSSSTTSTTVPSGSVFVSVGDSIQGHVNNNPAGTVFTIAAGVHSNQSVAPKDGNQFIGQDGAILDGQNSTTYAFTDSADNVRIENLEVRNYANPAQMGAIKAGGHTPEESTHGWSVVNSEIHHNAGGGVRIGGKMVLDGNHIHHNHQIGVSGIGDDTLIENNDISFNNYLHEYEPGWEAGGTKFVKTNRLIVRNNSVHDNIGPGLWTDIDNDASLIESNHVYNNTGSGIFHEISFSAVIRNNVVERNSSETWGSAGILIAASTGVEVYGNTVTDNGNGIVLTQQNRGGYQLDHVSVNGNLVRYTNGQSGWVGVLQDIGQLSVFDRDFTFQGNTYEFSDGRTQRFVWDNRTPFDFAEWQTYGHDN